MLWRRHIARIERTRIKRTSIKRKGGGMRMILGLLFVMMGSVGGAAADVGEPSSGARGGVGSHAIRDGMRSDVRDRDGQPAGDRGESLQAADKSYYGRTNGLSISLIFARSSVFRGVHLAGIGTDIEDYGTGLFVNGVGLDGGDLGGVAVSGFGVSLDDLRGVGIAGLGLESRQSRGLLLAGLGMRVESLAGVGIAGLGMRSGFADGVTVGIAYHRADVMHGVSLGVYNQADEAHGLMLGVLNRAEVLHGVQIGLLNFVGKGTSGPRLLPLVNARF